MKVDKFIVLKLVAKHLGKKIGAEFTDLNVLAASLAPMFNQQVPMLQKAGILDEDGRLDVELTEKKLISTFNVTPFFHIPMGTGKIIITKGDIEKFIADLKKVADVEEVICLPNK
nr:MAG TPA: hypothetical protein [Caudoviricetes sp.]